MKTICLAPLGMQPGAVVAPILSLGLADGDEVVLMTTKEIDAADITKRSEALLLRKLGRIGVRKERLDGVPADTNRFDRVILLINGGEAAAIHRLADELVPMATVRRVEFVESQGVRGTVFDRDGKAMREFPVNDVGLIDLLELLDLEYSEDRGVLGSRRLAEEKIVVEKVLERAGCLFVGVMVDANRPVNDKRSADRERLAAYRAMLRWQSLQQDLGLESRRMLLVHHDEPAFQGDDWPIRLAARAARDGIPALGRRLSGAPLDRSAWRRMVEAGEAADLPELLGTAEPRFNYAPRPWSGTGQWSGFPLYVIAGTQPGASLRTIWAHRPSRIVWIYDPHSPRVLDMLSRMRVFEKHFGASAIEFVPVARVGDMSPVDGAHVALTPGDKATKFRLKLWAKKYELGSAGKNDLFSRIMRAFVPRDGRESPAQTAVSLTTCYLDGNRISCGEHSSRVPLHTWISAHTDLYVTAEEVIRTTDEKSVEAIRAAALTVRGAIDADEMIQENFQPPPRSVEAVSAACGGVRDGGFWMEDLAGRLLSLVCDEVLAGTKLKRDPKKQYFEDEFDVLTSLNGCYALWSCKTAVSPLKLARAAREARAQATRFLGRMELAVVVTPWLRLSPKKYRAGQGWWQYDELTWIVDLGFLADAARVAKLAGGRPSGPRGAGRWNPFITEWVQSS